MQLGTARVRTRLKCVAARQAGRLTWPARMPQPAGAVRLPAVQERPEGLRVGLDGEGAPPAGVLAPPLQRRIILVALTKKSN